MLREGVASEDVALPVVGQHLERLVEVVDRLLELGHVALVAALAQQRTTDGDLDVGFEAGALGMAGRDLAQLAQDVAGLVPVLRDLQQDGGAAPGTPRS